MIRRASRAVQRASVGLQARGRSLSAKPEGPPYDASVVKSLSPGARGGHVSIGSYPCDATDLDELVRLYKASAVDVVAADPDLSRSLVQWQLCPDAEGKRLVSVSVWVSWEECRRVMASEAFVEAIAEAKDKLIPLMTGPPSYLDLPAAFASE